MATIGRNMNLLQLSSMLQPGYQGIGTLGSGGVLVYDGFQAVILSGAATAAQLKDPLLFRANRLWKIDWQADELAKQAPSPWMKDDTPSHDSRALAHAFMAVGHDGDVPAHDAPFRYEAAGKRTDRSPDDWDATPENLKEALQHIVETQLDGDSSRVRASREFRLASFQLPDGSVVNGQQFFYALVSLERPDVPRSKMFTVISVSEAARLAREKYLGYQDWDANPEALKQTLEYILVNHLYNDPGLITSGPAFRSMSFSFQYGGEITGNQILGVIASFEHPDMTRAAALKKLGGVEAARLTREKYLGRTPWDSSPETLKKALQHVVDTQLGGDPSRITSNRRTFNAVEFRLPGGWRESGLSLLKAVACFERPDLKKQEAFKEVGGAEAARLARENYLGLEPWDASPEKLKETLTYIVDVYLDGNPSRITTNHRGFSVVSFTLPSGEEITGGQLLRAIAHFELPDMARADAYAEIGGANVVRLAQKIYLGDQAWEPPAKTEPLGHPVWAESPQQLKVVFEYVTQTYLDGDPMRIGTKKSFSASKYRLADGYEVTGRQLLLAIASLERPDLARTKAYDEIGGAEVARIARERYLGYQHWDTNPEKFQETLEYIVATYLDGDPKRIHSDTSFISAKFIHPDGYGISGQEILSAIAGFERPDLARSVALKEIGRGEAARLARDEYLNYESWNTNEERLRSTLEYILVNYLDSDPSRIDTGDDFARCRFRLSDGNEVLGGHILSSVAFLERPELGRFKAFKVIGGAEAARLAREKYLGFESWDSNADLLQGWLQYIVETQLDGDPSRITSSPLFVKQSFIAPDGDKITGLQILYAVAALECPDLNKAEALKEVGWGEAARLAREKYLGFTGPKVEEIQNLPGISLLADTPLELMELVRILLPKGERMTLAEFIRSYAMLNLKEVAPDGTGGGSGRAGIAQGFLEALFSRRELLENLDEEKLDRLHDLYIHALYREHSIGDESLIAHLEDQKARSTDPLMKQFYGRAIAHFEGILSVELSNIKSQPFMHQWPAIKYLAEHERAILADEPGMGKTLMSLAAAELVSSKRILIVAPARGASTWAEEIDEHMEVVPNYIVLRSEDKVKLLSGDEEFRSKLDQAKYIIVNYEALREPVDRKDSNPLLAYLRNGADLDHIIVDESQNIDNPRATVQQAEAVRSLRPTRRWLVSATPYQSKRAHLFTALNYIDPKRFVWEDDGNGDEERISYRKFRSIYLKGDESSLKLLNGLLRQYMLRRRKDQVMGTVDETQALENQRGRIPKMDYVPHEQLGSFALSTDQALMMREMIADFRGWAVRYNEWVEAYNEALPTSADSKMKRQSINLENINPLSKLGWIRRIIADPGIAGLKGESPLYERLDRIVDAYRADGKKLILFANHTRVIDALEKRYATHGVVRIDGTVSRDQQDEARRRFNSDEDITIVVAHPRSGGVGINLPAGDAVIFVEQPATYVWRYQAEHRANRANPDFIKPTVKIISMVGTYPEGFVDETDDEVRRYFEGGTVSEIEAELIAKQRLEYLLVVDGYVDRADFDLNIRNTIAGALGWAREELPARIRRKPQLYDVLEALYERWKDLPHRRRTELVNVGEGILSTDIKKDDVQRIIASIAGGREADTDIAGSVFRLHNKFVRQKLLKRLLIELPVLHEDGVDVAEYAQELEGIPNAVRRLIVPVLLATRPWEGDGSFEVMKGLVAELSKMRGTPREVLAERVAVALATLGDDDADVRDFIERHESILVDADVPLEGRMRIFSDLAMLKGVTDRYLKNVLRTDYASFDELDAHLGERATRPVIRAMELPDTPEVRERLREIHEEWGSFEALLALHRSWMKAGYTKEAEGLREVFGHIVVGDYRAWRNDQTVTRTAGKRVEYLADKPDFWMRWNEEMMSRTNEIRIGGVKRRRELVKRVGHIMMEALKSGEMAAVEGDSVVRAWQNYIETDAAGRQTLRNTLEERKRALGNILSKGRAAINGAYERTRAELHDVNATLDWMALNETLRAFAKGGNGEKTKLLARLIKRKMIIYGGDGEITSPLGMELYNAGRELEALKSEQKVFKDVEIIDTDDPNLILRMGALRPDLINCFNFHADPDQNHTILDVLGSRNKRLVVAKSGGEIIAVAVAKVRKDDEGKPVIFLERALYREGYDFQDEMLAHLKKKRTGVDLKPRIAYQIPGKMKKGDIKVYATGSYAKHEYAEALFGVRPESKVWHRARLIEEDSQVQETTTGSEVAGFGDEVDGITGYGTSNRDINTFIAAMKGRGVRLIADIRSRPQSRWYPHFNRAKLEASLASDGIGYVWMGDVLGGYPEGYDGDFELYMKDDPEGQFSKGIETLRELAKQHGLVSLICSEGDENRCHRRFILKYLRDYR